MLYLSIGWVRRIFRKINSLLAPDDPANGVSLDGPPRTDVTLVIENLERNPAEDTIFRTRLQSKIIPVRASIITGFDADYRFVPP